MKQYFYIDNESRQQGPVPGFDLLEKGTLETLVWTDGLSTWTPAKEVEELAYIFQEKARQAAAVPQVTPAQKEEEPQTVVEEQMEEKPEVRFKKLKNQVSDLGSMDFQELTEKLKNIKDLPKSYFLMSILCAILVNPLFGIIAIYNSWQVPKLIMRNDVEKAIRHSERARVWCIAGLIFTFFFTIFIKYIQNYGVESLLNYIK